MAHKTVFLDQMTSPQVKKAIEDGFHTVLLAVGSTEQHGPHLPLGTDSMIGDRLMERIAKQLGKTLVAPTIRVGVSEHHMTFSGSMTLREDVLEDVIVDYCRSLARHGFRTIVVIPTHGGNRETVIRAGERLNREAVSARIITHPDEAAFVTAMVEVGGKHDRTPGEVGGHAGHLETSLMLADFPELVDMEKAMRGKVDLGFDSEVKLHTLGMHTLSPVGILGDATGSTAEAGNDYIESLLNALVDELRSLLSEQETKRLIRDISNE